MLHVEQKRTERSGKCLVLMLLEFDRILTTGQYGMTIEKVLFALSHSTRETDVKGWYKNRLTLGVVFTEIAFANGSSIADFLLIKVRGILATTIADMAHYIGLSTTVFPHDWDKKESGAHSGPGLPVELLRDRSERRIALGAKRFLDVAGSALALVAFLPLFVVIAVAIKVTSKGPILFRQKRVGQYGHPFQILKFRSMSSDNNHAIHQEFVKGLITGGLETNHSGQRKSVYKITNDPRVTAVGRFIRRTSLDELPQFFNVLKGEMSLVGPRPPIPYEVECYEIWHKRRLVMVKPGITGLWQVEGRSRTTFDEMVRLDLRYARTWSIWMDFRIMLATPRAMVSGNGAH
jgi:exopolysaccharide biosynthesis polyprenyl glycosylphosphotransferase